MTDREFLRHAVATVAYRAEKATRDAPPTFAAFRPGPASRTPAQVLAHIGDIFDWALSMANGEPRWRDSPPLSWEQERERFFTAVRALDAKLASEDEVAYEPTRLFQSAVADALEHVGQLAMLRQLHETPIYGESDDYALAMAGHVGTGTTAVDSGYDYD